VCLVWYSQGTARRTNERCSVAVQPAFVILSLCNIILEKLIPAQFVKKFPPFVDPMDSLSRSRLLRNSILSRQNPIHTLTLIYSHLKSILLLPSNLTEVLHMVLRLEMRMHFSSVLSVSHAPHTSFDS
jgi:hypothetical protein